MTLPAPRLLLPAHRRIERAAASALTSCVRALGLGELPLPVPVEQWAEGPLGFVLAFADPSELGPGVLGSASIADRVITVTADPRVPETRRRFTIAHELGHQLLHARLAPVFRDLAAESDFWPTRVEREADRFAAAFLMPLGAFEAELAAVPGPAEPASLRAAIESARGGSPPALGWLRSTAVPRVAERFQVSRAAAALRLADALLPDGRPALPGGLARTLAPHGRATGPG